MNYCFTCHSTHLIALKNYMGPYIFYTLECRSCDYGHEITPNQYQKFWAMKSKLLTSLFVKNLITYEA